MSQKDPQPYVIPERKAPAESVESVEPVGWSHSEKNGEVVVKRKVEGKGDDVKVYKVHTPFNPTSSIDDAPIKTHTTTVHSENPKNKYVSYDSVLGRSPGMTSCAHCHEQVLTNVTYKVGAFAWLMCILFILCGLVIGCCLIPFFLKSFKDAYHTCPRCQRILHVEKKRCC